MIRRGDIEKHEREWLAPYAALAAESRGRVYPEKPHPLRTVFQRDRDRIIHSAAFRRMEYKTQVFIPHLADHFRTRLTHTIEVAQIARTLARNLKLNEDLVEAVALVHDLGHTPFGHAGEDVLNDLLADHGGFNHNRQSLRVVDLLEQRYPHHPGLNLSYEVREGIVKHETTVPLATEEFAPEERPTLEAALVDKADELTYSAHDIDDGINSGLIGLDDLRGLSIWEGVEGLPGESLGLSGDVLRYQLVRFVIDLLATDLLENTVARIERFGIRDLADLRNRDDSVCAYSEETGAKLTELRSFLRAKLYQHPRLRTPARHAREVITFLFATLTDKPKQMPPRFVEMLDVERLEIVVADYIAGMTDRFAEDRIKQLD